MTQVKKRGLNGLPFANTLQVPEMPITDVTTLVSSSNVIHTIW